MNTSKSIDQIIDEKGITGMDDKNVKEQILTQLKGKHTVTEILQEREKTHGDYAEQAGMSVLLKDIIRNGLNWESLQSTQKEALDMIMHKVARIISGNPDYADHWDDIIGYATLVRKELG